MISQDELMYLQSQLEGLESIFLELMPFGVELKRHEVQQYYERRFDQAIKPVPPVAEGELRRQFNTKANQVRNLVDSAESLGDVSNKFNLIRAAACLPDERQKPLKEGVEAFCQKLVHEELVDSELLSAILEGDQLSAVEARTLLASTMFIVADDLSCEGKPMPLYELLSQFVKYINLRNILIRHDPFLVEASCALEALRLDEEEKK